MSDSYTEVRLISPNLSLAQLTTFLRQREADGFCILALSATRDAWDEHSPVHPNTIVTVINETPPPPPVQLIQYQSDDPPSPPAGGTRVCIGHCFIGGADTNVLVYR